jgi:hypothetical protein
MSSVSRRQVNRDQSVRFAGSASVVYITFGGVSWDYACIYIATSFAVTTAGQLFTYYVISRLGRRSIIVAAMAILLSAGAIIMLYEIFPALQAARHSGYFRIASICEQ